VIAFEDLLANLFFNLTW